MACRPQPPTAASRSAEAPSGASTTASPQILALTGLRFFAAFWVVVDHYRYFTHYPSVVRALANHGQAGVSLFFVLSGFVLVYTYADWFRHDTRRAWVFGWARFARIYPLAVLTLLLMTPVALRMPGSPLIHLQGHSTPLAAFSWCTNLFLVQAYFPSPVFHTWDAPQWSLSVEVTFYAVLPFFIRHVLAHRSTVRSLLTLMAVLFAVQVLLFVTVITSLRLLLDPRRFQQAVDYFVYFFPAFRVWEFFLGCTLGMMLVQSRRRGEVGYAAPILGQAGIRNGLLGATIVAALAGPVLYDRWVGTGPIAFAMTWYVLCTPVFVTMIATLAFGKTFLSRLLEHPVLVRLGEASYALYLLHWLPVTIWMTRATAGHRGSVGWVLCSLLATVLLAVGCYQFVEVPARRRLRQWGDRHLGARTVPRAVREAARAGLVSGPR